MQKPQSCSPDSSIKKIDSFAQASDVLNKADKNTLVLFDVDDTLIEPASVLFRPKTIENEAYRPWMVELTSRVYGNAPNPEAYYWSIWKVKEVPLLIEPKIVEIIRSLQDRGVKVMALTALKTGISFTIPLLPEWRFNKLKELRLPMRQLMLNRLQFLQRL